MIYFNQAYRSEKFFGIDFPNFFVWGDPTVTKMANPSCAASVCVGSDVVAGSSIICSSVKEGYLIISHAKYINHVNNQLTDKLRMKYHQISHSRQKQLSIVTIFKPINGWWHLMNVVSSHLLTT